MDGPDAPRRHHESDDPFLLTLTEEERLHGLDLFGDDPPQVKQPQAETQTYEHVPAYVDSLAPPGQSLERATPPLPPAVRRAPPVQPETWISQIWYAPLLAAVLTAVVVVYAVMTVVMRTTADGEIAALNDRILERNQAARAVPKTAAVAAVPEPAAVTVTPSAPSRGAPSATDEPTPPAISSKREAPRVRPAPAVKTASVSSPRAAKPLPIQESKTASVSSPRTAKPLPIRESTIAPLVGSSPPPASLSAEPRPVVASPATLPRAEASAAPAPRMPAPETAIQTVLSQYRTAYRDLDAGAARAVWPSVDTKALRKAFDRLEQQDLIFDSCQITVSDVRAVASCNGYAWYVPRVGNKGPHDDQRQWEFKLSKVEDAWLIDKVSAR